MIPTRTELDAAARASKRLAARYDGQRAVYNEAISHAIHRSGSAKDELEADRWLVVAHELQAAAGRLSKTAREFDAFTSVIAVQAYVQHTDEHDEGGPADEEG